MYARIQITSARPGAPEPVPPLDDVLSERPGFRGIAFCRQPDGPGGALVTFWATDQDARAGSSEPSAVQHSYDELFTVSSHDPGTAAGEAPQAINLVFFDSPRDDGQRAADGQASRVIRPGVAAVPGLVANFGLTRLDGSWAVVSFATSSDALAAVERTAIATTRELAAGSPEGAHRPDRVLRFDVVRSSLPARLEV